jgi:hypothetical protein
MEHPDKLKAQETIPAKQREFIDALSSLFSDEFRRVWIPVIAETCYQHIRKVEEKKKADLFGQVLAFRSRWMQDLRIKLLHDLALYIQANQSEFDGNAQRWMQERLTEIWSPAFTEEAYLEWLAAACDDTTNLESWRAPSWLPAALGLSNLKIRFEETDGSYGARLDLESTDELIRRDFKTEYLHNLLMGGFSEVERDKIVQLQVFIYQGFKIPPGFHDNHEESLLSATQRQLISDIRSTKGTKTSGRRRRKFSVYHERETKIRELIRRNPKVKGLIYCQHLDFEDIKTPPIWQAQGCPASYKEAYSAKDNRWKHLIHTEKSRLRPKSKKSQAAKSNN